jgi:hypothetical protein
VWEQKSAASFLDIFSSRFEAGTAWGPGGPTTQITTGSLLGDAVSPKIAADNAGNAVAVWYQDDGTGFSRVWANRYVAGAGPGSGWQAEQPIDNGAESAIRVALAMNAGGTAFAAWQQAETISGYDFIWANRYVPGTGWEGARQIESGNAGPAMWPHIAADPAGNAIAVWYQDNGTGLYNVWANRYSATDNSWGAPRVIQTDNTFDAITPRVAMDPGGNAVAVWRQSDGTRYTVRAARYVSGSGWQPAQQIGAGDTTGAQPKNSPHVAVDVAGNAIAVWAETDGVYFHVFSNRYVAGTAPGWSAATAVRLESDNTMQSLGPFFISPFVATGPSGDAMAVWTKPAPGGHMGVYGAHYDVGAGWGAAALVREDPTGDADKPVVTIDRLGNAYASWEVNDIVRSPGRGYLAIYR